MKRRAQVLAIIAAAAIAAAGAGTTMGTDAVAKAKPKLTGVDRLWQEWKRRHPEGDRATFNQWLEARPKAKKAVVDGKGGFQVYGLVFKKEGAVRAAGQRALSRRQAGAASGVNPKRYSDTGTYQTAAGVTRMDPKLARQYERQIRSYFRAKGSPLAKYAKNFVLAGDISGFDPRFLASIAVWETGAGTAIAYPDTRPFNFWNWNNTDSGAVGADQPWQNPDTAFRHYGEQFGNAYTGSNIYQDFGAYATDPTWEAKIGSTLRQLGGNPYDVRWALPAHRA